MALAASGSAAVADMLSRGSLRAQPASIGLKQQQAALFSPHLAASTSLNSAPKGSRSVSVRAKQDNGSQRAIFQGTQFFRKKTDDEEEEEEERQPAKGTIAFNFFSQRNNADKEEGEEEEEVVQTKRIVAIPEEVSAAPQSFLALVSKPFSALFRGRPADRKTVFVAGATGLTGARVVLELLSAGLNVRAGVEDLAEAQKLAEIAAQYKVISLEEAKRLNFVEYSADDSEFTAKAIANAGTVVVTVGAGENGLEGTVGADEALALVRAAVLANAPAFVLISEFSQAPAGVAATAGKSGGGGGGGFDFIGAILSFFKSLIKGPGEKVTYERILSELVEADALEYTVVRTGVPAPDSLASRSSVLLGEEGSLATGVISRQQIAQIVAEVAVDSSLGANKVFDAIAVEGGSASPLSDLLSAVPTDPRRQARYAAKAEADAKEQATQLRLVVEAEASAAAAEARRAAEEQRELEEEARRLAAEEARAAAAAARAAEKARAAIASVAGIEQNLKAAGAAVPPPAPAAAAPAAAAPSLPSIPTLPSMPSLSSLGDLAKKIPTPDLSSLAAAAKGGDAGDDEVEAPVVPKQRRPLRQRQPRTAPAPTAPAPAAAAPKVAGKKGGAKQEVLYADADAGDF